MLRESRLLPERNAVGINWNERFALRLRKSTKNNLKINGYTISLCIPHRSSLNSIWHWIEGYSCNIIKVKLIPVLQNAMPCVVLNAGQRIRAQAVPAIESWNTQTEVWWISLVCGEFGRAVKYVFFWLHSLSKHVRALDVVHIRWLRRFIAEKALSL